jgi:hypothetical protein
MAIGLDEDLDDVARQAVREMVKHVPAEPIRRAIEPICGAHWQEIYGSHTRWTATKGVHLMPAKARLCHFVSAAGDGDADVPVASALGSQ